jgi:hypothetical protein
MIRRRIPTKMPQRLILDQKLYWWIDSFATVSFKVNAGNKMSDYLFYRIFNIVRIYRAWGRSEAVSD